MSDIQANPNKTYALVAGIERYAAGDSWNLDGPAHDARRFVKWLHDNNVPAGNISLFLSPLESNKALLDGEPAARPATRQAIEDELLGRLAQKSGDLLYIFWGGHGVITPEGERRLYYADATTQIKLNLDVNSLLTTMRSDIFARLPRQIGVFDTCANYVDGWRSAVTLPGATLPRGKPLQDAQQFVLFAARAGDLATNLDREKTGLFSREVLAQLAAGGAWPPDMDAIAAQVLDRFRTLRGEGQTDQTPNFFAYSDWADNRRSLGQPGKQPAGAAGKPPPAPKKRTLAFAEKIELAQALLACDAMSTPNNIDFVLKQIRREITSRISYNANPQMYVVNIIDTCLSFAGAMREFIGVVRLSEGGSAEQQELDTVVDRLKLLDPSG
jgi:hypothetical protein